jgi:hypothetical protein
MMSGTSPYALANIGQGGVQGIAALSALDKQKALENAAIRKAQSSALEASHMYDYRQEQLKSLDENRKDRLALAQQKLENTAGAAQEAAEQKRLGLVNSALKNAANDDEYQSLVKELANLPEDDPKRSFIRQKMEAIKQSYIKTSLSGGKYVAPEFPTYQAPAEPPGVWENIKRGLGIMGGGGSSAQSGPVGTYVQGKGIVYNQ